MDGQLSKILDEKVNNHEYPTPPRTLGGFLKGAKESFDAHLAAE